MGLNKTDRATALSIILVVAIIVGCMITDYVDSHYTINAKVLGIERTTRETANRDFNEKESVVVVRDTRGHEWGFYGDGYNKGDKIKLTMSTNHTDNFIRDDEIIAVDRID